MPRIPLWIAVVPWLWLGCSDHITTSTDMVFDEEEPAPGRKVTFTSIEQEVFGVYCAVPGCHASSQYPDLSSGRAYASIVDMPSTAGLALVAPGRPDSSYLYLKVTGAPGIRGERMPYGGPPLPQATVEAVRAWIERGAPND
ncbi:MAG: hypothetical protein AB1505_25610 [Candidatus Latescibacterota bacterium]